MRKIMTAALAAVVLAGCGTSGEAEPVSDTAETSAATEPVESVPPEPSEMQTEPPAPPTEEEAGYPVMGEDGFRYDDGLLIEVGAPEQFEPTEFAAGGESFEHHVAFDVLVTNESDEPYDVSLFTATIQSGGREGEQVFDTEQLGEGPMTTVLPGRDVEFRIAFGVEDPDDLVLEITPDFIHEPAIFVHEG